ncbi:lipopolysaccharide biosynthesis protein [Lacrimispora sp. 210928-DFI.3.58]|uniref:lipopolysaccharide biosynthesis protein n=1 Tax=Lacrimispora sp. 210928-DFI.3.58 TaxID=2883214 RepID=UPI001D060255|nr:hypothetical protein [Lacrimispora sp. 210928-DFI.3.58]MCB7319422.1 hypothetical protein [Lacrimispora sp. 210928-DFI.3.58]
MSRIDAVAKNVKFAACCQISLMAANFIVRKAFVAALGEEYLGLSGLFADILSMLSLAELGFGASIIFSLYKPVAQGNVEKVKSLMELYRRAYMLVGTAVICGGLALTPYLDFFIKEMPASIRHIEWIYVMNVVNSGASYFFIYKASLLFADQKKYVEMIINAAVKLSASVLQVAALFATKNYFVYLGIMVGATFAQNLMISAQVDKRYPYLKEKNIKPLEEEDKAVIRRNVGAMVFHKLGDVAVFGTDSVITAKFISLSAVGLYSNYMLIRKALLNMIFLAFNGITSSLGNLNACESGERKIRAFYQIHFFSAWLFGCISICLLHLYNPFIALWLGEEYLFPFPIVLLIVLNFYVYCMRMPVNSMKEVMGLFWNDRYKPLLEAGVNLAVSVILAKRMGMGGVLLGTLASTIAVPFWVEPFVLFRSGLKEDLRQYFKRYAWYLAVTLSASIVTGLLCRFSSPGFLGFLWKMVLCAFVPNIIYLLVYRHTEEYQYLKDAAIRLLGKALNRIGGKRKG